MRQLLTLFLLICFLCFFTKTNGQNIRFSFITVQTSPTTTDVQIYAETTAGTENLTGYTTYFYYDNAETTVTGFDSSPTTTALGWGSANQSTIMHQSESNGSVTITHTGYFFYQNFDNAFTGDDMTTTPTHLLTISFDHTVGTSSSGYGWLGETDEVPPLRYTNNLFQQFNVLTAGTQSQMLDGGTLPVELLSFTARKENQVSRLDWSTASEIDNKGFEVQRLSQEDKWEVIGFVNGNGTSGITNQYHFYDKSPRSEINYYRLKQIDFDGKFEYSNIASVAFENLSEQFQIYPNPMFYGEKLFIKSPFDDAEVFIFDQHSKLVQRLIVSQGAIELSLSDYTTGIYYVKLVKDSYTQVQKLIVVK